MADRKHYHFDIWQEDNIWSWIGEADSEEEAQQAAVTGINKDWYTEYETWDDLAADMDGTSVIITDLVTARARREAPAMLEILRGIDRDDDGDAMLDAAGMDRIAAILSRIDGDLV